jgi:di/tricarboxylate transporter
MTPEAWYTLAVLAVMVGGLVRGLARPDLVMLGALGLLLLGGVLGPEAAFAGFANPAVITIGSLFVVAAGVERTGALGVLDRLLRPRSDRPGPALARLMLPTALFSGVLNNTPIVAMLIPRVQAWARATGLPASKLLLPLSTAAIVGGWLTLIGTSTNVVVHGLLLAEGLPGLSFFDLAWVGVPAVVLVTAYYTLAGHRLLPAGAGAAAGPGRTYRFDLAVGPDAPFAGRTVEGAGLRDLGDAYLAHLRRAEAVVEVSPETALFPGDVLAFVGDVRAHDELLARPGLVRTVPEVRDRDRPDLPLVEVVVAAGSGLEGRSLQEVGFRERYGGVVIAVQRRGEAVRGGLGRVPLRAGDLLLVEGRHGVAGQLARHPEDFALVAPVDAPRLVSDRAPVALALLAGLVVCITTELLPLSTAAFCAALGTVVTGCLRGRSVYRALDGTVLLVIAASLGVGQAVQASGLAGLAAGAVEAAAGAGGVVVLVVALFALTNVLTEVVSNSAAAALMVPVATATAADLGVEPRALALVVAVGAGASFLTPIGYQTNLMVMGAGGYRYTDYTRAGLPVTLIVLALTLAAALFVWL